MPTIARVSARRLNGTSPKCPTCQMRQAWVVQETLSRLMLVCAYCRHAWSVANDDDRPRARRIKSPALRIVKRRSHRTR